MKPLVGALLSIFAACGGTTANLCDSASNNAVCSLRGAASQCVEYTGLSTADLNAVTKFCTDNNGTVGTAACDTTGTVGTCKIPPTAANSGVSCSANATITIHDFPPKFTTAGVQALCSSITGATFTPPS